MNNNTIQIGVKNRMRGEYRATLRGPDNRIKYQSGWEQNAILNQGLAYATQLSKFTHMGLGDSAAAVVTSQTGGQGNFLGSAYYDGYGGTYAAGGAPDYWKSTTQDHVFPPGNSTGTIRELVLASSSTGMSETEFLTTGAVRAVLTTPIVKGALDELTIEHRLYLYPEIIDQTGIVNISGVDYNWTIRLWGVNWTGGLESHSRLLRHAFGNVAKYFSNVYDIFSENPLDAFTSANSTDTGSIGSGEVITIRAGSYPDYYTQHTIIADIDSCNGNFNKIAFRTEFNINNPSGTAGYQIRLVKTADGVSSFTKENTHEFQLVFRVYAARYVP